jgi:tetratricopeptide (TPR) repeat protein
MAGVSREQRAFLLLISFVALFSSVMGQENTSNYWMERGDGFYNAGSLELANKCYDKVLELDSKNVSAWYKKGVMLSSQFKKAESLNAFDGAINLSPEDSNVWNAKGLGLYISAKLDEAVDDQLIDLNSEHTIINNKNTSIKILKGSVGYKEIWDYPFNVSSQTRRIAAGLNTVDNLSEIALVFENPSGIAKEENADLGAGKLGPIQVATPEIGQWRLKVYGYNVPDGAREAFSIKLINQLYSPERFISSLDAYDEAIKLDPMSLTPIIQKATVLMDSGEFRAARDTIDSALKIDPSNPKAWYTKGMILIKQGYYEDALKSLSVSIELAPAFADAWHYKGIDLQYLGRDNEASIALNKSSMLGYANSIAILPTTEL